MSNPTNRPEVFIFEADAKAVLPAAESFNRHGFRVVVGSSQRYCMGFYSRHVRERIVYPHEQNQADDCLAFLLDLVKRRRFEMIVPLGDVVTQRVCSRREEFQKHTKLMLVPYDIFMIGRDKVQTMKAAEASGVPIPKTYYPDEQSLDDIAKQVEFPVLVKPAMSNGARGIWYVHDKDELVRRYEEVEAEYGRTFVQELIPHEGTQYKTELLLDKEGTVLASLTYAKLRYYPPNAGSSTLNVTVDYPEMEEHSIRLARDIGWYGMCDFDYIYDVRDRKPKLMEINPRVTDTIRIANLAGIDYFRKMYLLASGQAVEPATGYKKGLYMRFLPGELMWFLTAKGKRFSTKPGFFKSFFMDMEYLVVSLHDPGPIMGYCLEAIAAILDPKQLKHRLRLQRS